jgi:hypothetical protein
MEPTQAGTSACLYAFVSRNPRRLFGLKVRREYKSCNLARTTSASGRRRFMKNTNAQPIIVGSVESVAQLFDTLSTLPRLTHCGKCGDELLHLDATFFSYRGKAWTLPLPFCTFCARKDFNRLMNKDGNLGKDDGSQQSQQTHTWKQLYADALCESNTKILLRKIASAEKAIDQRALALMEGEGDCDAEKQELTNAQRLLNDLKRIYDPMRSLDAA